MSAPLKSFVTAPAEEGRFLALEGGGYVVARHTLPVGETADDPVAIAETFVGTPYLWGGRTSIGLDCSGLVQLAAEAAGLSAPRDADMQAAELGEPVSWRDGAELSRGDLVFWKGHLAIVRDEAERSCSMPTPIIWPSSLSPSPPPRSASSRPAMR